LLIARAQSGDRKAFEELLFLVHPMLLRYVTGMIGWEARFSLTALDGRVYSLAELRGKLVLVNFWGTSCMPCRKEMPEIERLYASSAVRVCWYWPFRVRSARWSRSPLQRSVRVQQALNRSLSRKGIRRSRRAVGSGDDCAAVTQVGCKDQELFFADPGDDKTVVPVRPDHVEEMIFRNCNGRLMVVTKG